MVSSKRVSPNGSPVGDNGLTKDQQSLPGAPLESNLMPVEGRYDSRGILAQALEGGTTRSNITRQVLAKLVDQLSLVCTWPTDSAERVDVVGSYRFFILEFAPQERVSLYLQLWSEPGDSLLFEVSSGHVCADGGLSDSADPRGIA